MNQGIFFYVLWLKYILSIYMFLLCCCVVCPKAMLYEHSWETFFVFWDDLIFVIFGWITPIYSLAQCRSDFGLAIEASFATYFNVHSHVGGAVRRRGRGKVKQRILSRFNTLKNQSHFFEFFTFTPHRPSANQHSAISHQRAKIGNLASNDFPRICGIFWQIT